MRNQTSPSESTIIIEPGSHFLKIGRASEPNPKRLAHCIARKIRCKVYDSEPLISGNQLKEGVANSNSSLLAALGNVFSMQSPDDLSPVFSVPQAQLSSPNFRMKNEVFTVENDARSSDVYVLEDALEVSNHPNYLFRWPFKNGFLNDSANCSAVIQDLEDIWTAALDKHVSYCELFTNSISVTSVVTFHFSSLLNRLPRQTAGISNNANLNAVMFLMHLGSYSCKALVQDLVISKPWVFAFHQVCVSGSIFTYTKSRLVFTKLKYLSQRPALPNDLTGLSLPI